MMQLIRNSTALIVTGSLLYFWGGPAFAADSAGLDALVAAFGSATLSESDRQTGAALLDVARADVIETERVRTVVSERRAEAAAHALRVRELETSLAIDLEQSLSVWTRRLPSKADAETLERVLTQERNLVAEISAQINLVSDELALLLSGPAEAADSLARLRERLAALRNPPVSQGDEPRLIAEARRLQQTSERDRIQSEMELAELDQTTIEQRQALRELRLRELRHRGRLHNARILVLQERTAMRATDELRARVATLAATVETVADAPAGVRTLAADNLALGNELETNVRALADDRLVLPELERARDDVVAALKDSRTRLELGGASEGVGRWLWSERRRLESPARLQQELETVRNDLADLRLRLVVISEEQRKLTGRTMFDASEIESQTWRAERIRSELDALGATREELLGLLQAVLQRRIVVFEQQEGLLSEQLAQTTDMQKLLDRQLLWIRSHRPVDAEWIDRVPVALRDIFSKKRFDVSANLAVAAMVQSPLLWLFSGLGVLILLQLRRQAGERITAEAAVTRQIRKDNYRATARALGWTLIAASPLPALLAVAGALFSTIGQAGYFSHSLGLAMITTAGPLYFVQLLRFAVIERGLSQAHFRWLSARRQSLAAMLPTLAWLILPLYFFIALSTARGVEASTDVVARLAIVLVCGVLSWAMWWFLAPGRVWVVRGREVEPSLARKAVRAVGTLAPLLVALLAYEGFVYSSSVLMQAALETFEVVVVIAVLTGLLGRWFLLGERRLTYQQLVAQQEPAAPGEVRPDPESAVTLEQISAQTGRILRAFTKSFVVIALVWVWADVLPAFTKLEEISIWTYTDTGADGETFTQPVTLMAVLLGGLALFLTLSAARNVPGLVELGLMSRTRIDAPTRYAITSLMRYGIVLAGTVIGLGFLGLRWSQLQWMAAALTVGLAFGLQEIFANFFSGLILLFERPFRIGDVITVGELTGTVNRIRTRATTIIDFDNKEIVVPNKILITSHLTNWTLTDPVTRLTIKVGVDYGTEPEVVHRLLLQAAGEVPQVLKNPEPMSWFVAFGPSSLDFELRVFVGSVADRLVVQDALHTRINKLLLENGIDIAYPQLSVHLKEQLKA